MVRGQWRYQAGLMLVIPVVGGLATMTKGSMKLAMQLVVSLQRAMSSRA